MAEIVTYLLSDEKWPFVLNGDLSNDRRLAAKWTWCKAIYAKWRLVAELIST